MNPTESSIRPRLMLHVCCAPDVSVAIERSREEFDLALFFYDPNIHPYDEYRLRADEVRRIADQQGVLYYEGTYDVDRWRKAIAGNETQLERGPRCSPCFDVRLEETARLARQEGYGIFSTVLTTSPKKSLEQVFNAGRKAEEKHGVRFLEADWKKEGGYARSLEMAEELSIYRQNYCGCEPSLMQREIEEKLKAQYESRLAQSTGETEVRLFAQLIDAEGRWLWLKSDGAWSLPNLPASPGVGSRQRVNSHLRSIVGIKAKLESEPEWLEFTNTQDPTDKRRAHLLCWSGQPQADSALDPEKARWLSAKEIGGYKVDPASAEWIRRLNGKDGTGKENR